jgi:hypothetical protein
MTSKVIAPPLVRRETACTFTTPRILIMPRTLLALTLMAFGALTAAALWHHGLVGIFTPLIQSLAARRYWWTWSSPSRCSWSGCGTTPPVPVAIPGRGWYSRSPPAPSAHCSTCSCVPLRTVLLDDLPVPTHGSGGIRLGTQHSAASSPSLCAPHRPPEERNAAAHLADVPVCGATILADQVGCRRSRNCRMLPSGSQALRRRMPGPA